MITTKIAEKERKIREKLRIKEVIDKEGERTFYPQSKTLGIWHNFYKDPLGVIFADLDIEYFYSLSSAKQFIDDYVNKKLNKVEIIYHDVNYLTH